MGRFVTADDVKVLHAEWWDEGETVTIRRYTVTQRDRMHGEILRVTGQAGSKLTEVEVSAAQLPVLVAGIKEWTLKRPDGAPAPCKKEWIGKLSGEDADFITDEIREYNPGRTQEEQDSF